MAEIDLDPVLVVETEELCSTCRRIDFSTMTLPYDVPGRKLNGDFMNLNRSFAELEASTCPLCQLFASMQPVGYNPGGNNPCRLLTLSAMHTILANYGIDNILRARDFPLLAVVNDTKADGRLWNSMFYREIQYNNSLKGYLCPFQADHFRSGFGVRRVRCHQFDLESVKEQLHHCSTEHRICCPVSPSSVADLKVVDCKSQQVVDAPPLCEYVALSYVWCESPEPDNPLLDEKDPEKLQNVPRVIKDCIDLALRLGYRYAWFDRYCIDQQDEKMKASQIAQMDLIYTQAQLTVIAAAPGDGLRGMNGSLRAGQKALRLGDWIILSTLPSPGNTMKSSTWNTRGWTYQEGILSVRKLIFTEHQVVFECNGISCAEAYVYPLADMLPRSEPDESLDIGIIFRPQTRGSATNRFVSVFDTYSFMEPISEFYTRQLSFASDRLKALEGIFAAFTRIHRRPVYALMGILMIPSYYELFSPAPVVLPYIHAKDRFIRGLTWSHICYGVRLYDFPSWTWAGWKNGNLNVDLFNLDISPIGTACYKFDHFADIKVWIDDFDGHLEFPEFDNLPSFVTWTLRNPHYIYIEGPVINIKVVMGRDLHNINGESLSDPKNPTGYSTQIEWYAKVESTKTGIFYAWIKLSRRIDTTVRDVVGILLEPSIPNTPRDSSLYIPSAILVLENLGDHYERIGIFESSSGYFVEDRSCLEEMIEGDRGKQWWTSMRMAAPIQKIKIG